MLYSDNKSGFEQVFSLQITIVSSKKKAQPTSQRFERAATFYLSPRHRSFRVQAMITVEPETGERFYGNRPARKVYNQNACMDGIVVRIDVREWKNMSCVFQEALVRRLTGGYEVVLPPVDRSSIPDTSDLFYDHLAIGHTAFSQP